MTRHMGTGPCRLLSTPVTGSPAQDGTISEYRPTFDAQAFRNLLLYIAQRNADDPAFGKTRLWKEL